MKNINTFFKDYFNEILKIYEKNLNELVEKYLEKLLDEVKNFNMDFILERRKYVEMKDKKGLENALKSDIFLF